MDVHPCILVAFQAYLNSPPDQESKSKIERVPFRNKGRPVMHTRMVIQSSEKNMDAASTFWMHIRPKHVSGHKSAPS